MSIAAALDYSLSRKFVASIHFFGIVAHVYIFREVTNNASCVEVSVVLDGPLLVIQKVDWIFLSVVNGGSRVAGENERK
jgi:hypothetical protein